MFFCTAKSSVMGTGVGSGGFSCAVVNVSFGDVEGLW